jgi:Immunoglobulin-like domain of bacterial spore germination
MTRVEEQVREALSAATAGIRPDEGASQERIATRTIVVRRRRRTATIGTAALVIAAAGITIPRLWATREQVVEVGSPSTPVTAPTVPPSYVFPLRPSDGSTDPSVTAERFVRDWLGFPNAMVGEFQTTPGLERTGEVAISSRKEDGTPGRQVSTLALQQAEDGGIWYVTSARADNVVIDSPTSSSVVVSPLGVSGRGVGFENAIVVRLRDGKGDILCTAPAIADAPDFTQPGPFAVTLEFGPPATSAGVLVATTDAPAEFATPDFTALPVNFSLVQLSS